MKPRSWQPWIFIGLTLLLCFACMGLFIWAISQFGWEWTGFTAYSPPTPQYERGKTLWDWLQLLVVPAILAAGAGFFTWWSARTERHIAQQRYEQDQKLALEKQREDLLQSYLDRMAELLLEKGLRDSHPDAEVRKVARTRTVSTLIQLDSKRARTIFVFLGEAQLTEELHPILSFEDADLSSARWSQINLGGFNLSGANLSNAYLMGANLSGVKLKRANLNNAYLMGANLSGAVLSEADLNGAYIIGADLNGAHLNEIHLFGADLRGAHLNEADLRGADLRGAHLNEADLSGANLSGAVLFGAKLSRVKFSGTNLFGTDLSGVDLNGADLSKVHHLEFAQLNKTNLRGVTGLTPAQLAHYKASGALVDDDVTSSSQSATIASSLQTLSHTLPSPNQAVTSTHLQETTPEDASSCGNTAIEHEDTPATPLSLSQKEPPTASLQQGNATTPSSSQDAAS